MAIRIKYNNIIKQLKEVSMIDVESVYFAVSSQEECPDCGIDPVTNTATDPFCPTCGGTGYVEEEDRKSLTANVDYISGMESERGIGGKLKKGNIVVTVIVDELESAGFIPEDFFEKDKSPIDYCEVNNIKYQIEEVTPGKLQGILYELIIELEPIKGR